MVKSLSLDNAVVAQIEKEAREEERPFSQIVNRRLRVAFGLGVRRAAGRALSEDGRAAGGGVIANNANHHHHNSGTVGGGGAGVEGVDMVERGSV